MDKDKIINLIELEEKLLKGERVFNPVVRWRKYGKDKVPVYRYPSFILNVFAKKAKKELVWDFDTEESYLK